jgi:outer membrane protein assembly factor BamA
MRIGGHVGMGFDLARMVRMYIDYRAEHIKSDIPPGAVRRRPGGSTEPMDFGVKDGSSMISLFGVSVEWDTRSDPVLPHRGTFLSVNGDFASSVIGSGYDFFKLRVILKHYFPIRWGHVLSAQFIGGVVFGEAPFFEKFFIGDFNDLVPGRALRLNFSTLPSRDIFGTSIDAKRYEEFVMRASLEYISPWFRGGRFFYSGDFFINVGVLMLTSKDEWRVRDQDLSASIPLDLTLDAGLRLDTYVGVFRLSLGNALGRIPF